MSATGARERELAAYYDQDAPARASRQLEGRESVIEVGVGPGRDAAALSAASPIAIGLWGGPVWKGRADFDNERSWHYQWLVLRTRP